MKNPILLFILLSSSHFINGQNYTPFNFNNGIWLCNSFDPGQNSFYQYYCNGDTIINDTTYFKMYENARYDDRIRPPIFYKGYVCAIKNNENKQVLVFDTDKQYSTILYDFNLSVNDTIKHFDGFEMHNLIIKEIDSVSYCNHFYKRYVIDSQRNLSFIEGIGFSRGLFGYNVDPDERETHLLCYNERNNKLCEDCFYNFLVNTDVSLPKDASYFNLDDNFLIIESSKQIKQICLFDLNGRNVYLKTIVNDKKIKIKLALNSGFYIVQIHYIDNSAETKKIIIK